jgi:hypothetical protein
MPCWPILFRQIQPAVPSARWWGTRWWAARPTRRIRSAAGLRSAATASAAAAAPAIESAFAIARRSRGRLRRRWRGAVSAGRRIRRAGGAAARRISPSRSRPATLSGSRGASLLQSAVRRLSLFLAATTPSSASPSPARLGWLGGNLIGPGALGSRRRRDRKDARQPAWPASPGTLITCGNRLLPDARLELRQPFFHRTLDLRPRRTGFFGPDSRPVRTDGLRRWVGIGRFRFDREIRREFGHLRQCYRRF